MANCLDIILNYFFNFLGLDSSGDDNWYDYNDEYECSVHECKFARDLEELNEMLDTIKDENDRIIAEVDWFLEQQAKENDEESESSSDEDSEASYYSEEDESPVTARMALSSFF